MNHAHRHATGTPEISPLIAGGLGLAVLIVIIGDGAAQLGARLDGDRPPPIAPLSLALDLADGKTHWPPAATAIGPPHAGYSCSPPLRCSHGDGAAGHDAATPIAPRR